MVGYIVLLLDGVRVYDGVQEVFDYFREVNIIQFVLINKFYYVVNVLFKVLGLDIYFELILGFDGEFQGAQVVFKFDFSTFNVIIEWLGVERSGVWMIGDGVFDV